MENIIPLGLLGVFALFLYSMIRIAQVEERFAVMVFGRFQKLVGPGLALKFPGTGAEWKRIAVGDVGEYLGDRIAKFGNVSIPIEDAHIPEGHRIRITSFRDNKVWTSDEGPKKEYIPCERCGYKTPA